jgi:ring-1,2-phenylacetyl-CoA epoxidase subunit PaaB
MSNVYWPLYEVFVRSKQGLSHRHVGSLHAADDRMALENARDAYTRRSEGCSIWVVKASEIVASQPEERRVLRPGGKQGLPPPDVLHHP